MIAGSLQIVEAQALQTPAMRKAIDFLKQAELGSLPEGRVEIDGGMVYALVQSYDTIPIELAKIEAHKKYIDLQYICEGEEYIGWIPVRRLVEVQEYNDAKDVYFGKIPLDKLTLVRLGAGELAVLFPEDAHAPKVMVGSPARVKKIVVKVAV